MSKQKVGTPTTELVAADSPASVELVEIVVVADAMMWSVPDKFARRGFQHHGEIKGSRVLVPASVLEDPRHDGEWVLASEADEQAVPQALPETVLMTDEALAEADEDTVLAYLNQNPSEAYRIGDLEAKRSVVRDNIVFAADDIIAKLEAGG